MKLTGLLLSPFLLSQLCSAIPTAQSEPCDDADGNKLGAVASESKECSEIGAQILKKGGNAADSMASAEELVLAEASKLIATAGRYGAMCGGDWDVPQVRKESIPSTIRAC